MVYVIIVNWCNFEDTIECLRSLALMDYPDFRVIVCDNNSTDSSCNKISNWIISNNLSNFSICEMGANLGFAGANNAGINIALLDEKTKYIWILNNDTEVKTNSLTELVNTYESDPQNGIAGSVLLYTHSKTTIQAIGGHYNSWLGISKHIFGRRSFDQYEIDNFDFSSMDYVVGASMLISREFVNKVGLMDPNYFLYGEDLDWSVRAKRMNLKLTCASKSIVYHKEGGTTKTSVKIPRRERNSLADKFSLRSNLILSMKLYPIKHVVVRLVYFAKALRRLAIGDIRGACRTLFAMLFVWR